MIDGNRCYRLLNNHFAYNKWSETHADSGVNGSLSQPHKQAFFLSTVVYSYNSETL